MRDINRIDKFCEDLAKEWKKVPDWRFGQLIVNIFSTFKIDPFFPEEDKMMRMIQDYFKNYFGENKDETNE